MEEKLKQKASKKDNLEQRLYFLRSHIDIAGHGIQVGREGICGGIAVMGNVGAEVNRIHQASVHCFKFLIGP